MYKITPIFIIVLLVLFFEGLKAQGLAGCNPCDQETLKEVPIALNKKTRLDSVRAYHLLANIKWINDKDLDSTCIFLEKVFMLDSSYISRMYNGGKKLEKLKGKNPYFLATVNSERIEKYLIKSSTKIQPKIEIDTFWSELNTLDQSNRLKYDSLYKIKTIGSIEKGKVYNIEFELESCLLNIKNSDSLVLRKLISKFDNDINYFLKEFNSEEKMAIQVIMLHLNDKINQIDQKHFKTLLQYNNITANGLLTSLSSVYNKFP